MSTSATQSSEVDIDIHNTKKKIKKRMSISTTQLSKTDVDIRNDNKSKF